MLDHDRLADVVWPSTPFPLEEHLVLLARRGSEAHGTYRAPTEPDAIDDRDLYGVVVPPLDYYVGLRRWEHAEEINGPWDVVLDEIRKFVRLLCNQNPNVLSLLWLRSEDYLVVGEIGAALLAERELFRARSAAFESFVGYARGQLKQMTSTGAFKGYMGAKRKRLVERFGYDTKDAAHLVRLLRMGAEYLATGKLTVHRHDAAALVAIKRGEWTLAEVKREAERLFAVVQSSYEKSPLPEEIDTERVNALLTEWLGKRFALDISRR